MLRTFDPTEVPELSEASLTLGQDLNASLVSTSPIIPPSASPLYDYYHDVVKTVVQGSSPQSLGPDGGAGPSEADVDGTGATEAEAEGGAPAESNGDGGGGRDGVSSAVERTGGASKRQQRTSRQPGTSRAGKTARSGKTTRRAKASSSSGKATRRERRERSTILAAAGGGQRGKAAHADGWLTIVKGGRELVRLRDKLNAGQRQRHMQQWARRNAADKTLAATSHTWGEGGDAKERSRATAKGKSAAYVAKPNGNVFAEELRSDPTEIGFAFGGVDPGTLHAKGQLHEVHRVTYSVGRAGAYLLHVRLRTQALPLPGSPFRLAVRPGAAHPAATSLPSEALPLRGIVGLTATSGCHLTLATADKMGNMCDAGGAKIRCLCADAQVETEVVDHQGAPRPHLPAPSARRFPSLPPPPRARVQTARTGSSSAPSTRGCRRCR